MPSRLRTSDGAMIAKRATKKPDTISRMKTMYTDIGTCKLLALKLMPKATSDPNVP